MNRDLAEKEREFLDSLEADTGRTLAQWMAVLDDMGFPHRNDAIDWLRQQGFLFSWASWLERIHNNGGRPIYCDAGANGGPASSAPPKQATAPTGRSPVGNAAPQVAGSPRQIGEVLDRPPPVQDLARKPLREMPAGVSAAPASAAGLAPEVKAAVAAARALAPLTGFILRRVGETVPGAQFRPVRKGIRIECAGAPFALIAFGARNLKVAFAGPPGRFDPPAAKASLPPSTPAPAGLTHMIVLDDARQVNEAFTALIADAAARVR